MPVPGRTGEPFSWVARLASITLNVPLASVTVPGPRPPSGMNGVPVMAGAYSPFEQSLCAAVVGGGDKVVIDDARTDWRANGSDRPGMIAWAGFPMRAPDGHVMAVLWVADSLPRQWSSSDVTLLETLAQVAAREFALQDAVVRSDESTALARMLQESLLPPRLPDIPGLQVAAEYAAGGTGAEVLGDFYDVFPSVRGSWGMVVGDVCGKGVPAAKSTALARYTLRAEAHRKARPSLVLAGLNQALLDWLTDDPRFLTAIYATVRPVPAGATVRISSAGHPLAVLRRADGHVQDFGRPGTLLGILADPELHDSSSLLHAGDSLILFSDGITEARRADRDLYGEQRLRGLAAGLAGMTAAQMAQAIMQATQAFSGGHLSDDTVALVMKVHLTRCRRRRRGPAGAESRGPSGLGGGRGGPAGRRRPGQPADGVEMAQRLGVGAEQGGLAVRQPPLGTEGGDQWLGPAQAGPGHGREQMMLDLVIQATQGHVGEPAAADVAGGQYLAAQEVDLLGRIQHRHALVIGRERAAEIEPEQALLDDDEHDGFDR